MLYGATQPRSEYLFGESIAALADRGDSVSVTFERAPARSFDLVIGADGLHSNVRRLVFGRQEQFAKRLGTYVAIFTVPNFLDLDYWETFNMTDTSSAGVYSARDNTEAQFTELERRMAGDGWVRPQLLEYMRTAPDFYFDEMAQIIMDRWSQGRVALVGDAGYCCSPLSGQGTSVALLGAYILAGELAEADGDHALGFANYFTAFGDYVLDHAEGLLR